MDAMVMTMTMMLKTMMTIMINNSNNEVNHE